jgi:hypothetical protein
VGKEQLILSMGLVWMEVRILAQRATTPSKGFFCVLPQAYSLFIENTVNIFLCFSYFFLSMLKINHVPEIRNMCGIQVDWVDKA